MFVYEYTVCIHRYVTLTWLRLTLRKHKKHTAMMLAATMKLTTTPTKITKMMTYSLLERSTGMMTVVLTEWLPAHKSQENTYVYLEVSLSQHSMRIV